MKTVDYIIVGQGVAGSCMALKLLENNKSFVVIDDNAHKASAIAAGIYNPVVLKRFAIVWNAIYQIQLLKKVFSSFEQLLNQKYLYEFPVFRIFNDENEKKTWLKKSDREDLNIFLSKDFTKLDHYSNIKQPLGTGEVQHTGRIDLTNLLPDFKDYLLGKDLCLDESFDYETLQIFDDKVIYKEIEAKKIIFAEGYHIKQNPWFNQLPIIGVKGEVLRVKTNANLPDAVVKAKEFLMPLGNNEYFVGATYDRDNVNYQTTEAAKENLVNGLNQFLSDEIEVIDQKASIRPTVSDRRPIIGSHPKYKNLICLNGMGTRGTMLAPVMVEDLYNYLENETILDKESDISRFYTLLNDEL
ncbi:NAD(P)/FAD-dependent oxidoreductase [Faecalibacter bovis]|uniref:FAD-dependent oxidoreductase n=1 Tax=Faecalibacter bovis TaxID=2898187 RepID=A0ABX7XE48_9FLAO|nr:FAD-dependent oxidoreductase [Faecalibacter bovis]QTV06207.1 FAD-dependent oxidoreductase [Faecalibacter bovis]